MAKLWLETVIFVILKGTQTLVDILREKPHLADWWIEQEQKVQKYKKDYGSNYAATFKKDRDLHQAC